MRKARIDKGLCKYCLIESLECSYLCEKHWYQRVSYQNLGTIKYWEQLKTIAEKQHYKCIYTDELLIPAFNMSLDHIKSRKRNPELKNCITNVQWDNKQINIIKNELSHDEFIILCKKITKSTK